MTDAATLHSVFWARLEAITTIDTYDAEVPATPPLDPDGRVRKYAVLYASPGNLHATALDGGQRGILGSAQVTCVGGDPARALACVDTVRTGVLGTVTVDGATRVIRARQEDPGPVRTDPNVWPPRHYVPFELQLFAP